MGYSVETYYAPLVLTLRSLPIPVICAVNGVAMLVRANIALACDIVLAKQIGQLRRSVLQARPDPRYGRHLASATPGGPRAPMGMAMLGEKISAETAEQWGLIWRCVSDEGLMDEATTMAAHLAIAPTKGLAFTKRAIAASYANTLPEQLKLEGEMMRELGYSHDYREGVAAFIAKRPPHFTGE
ncbi:enoyl-CoA hydratase-related protein [Massilia sp. B-10]|nr:enoyl-CoA hydratase-related protein [Massilia sp. B-10]